VAYTIMGVCGMYDYEGDAADIQSSGEQTSLKEE